MPKWKNIEKLRDHLKAHKDTKYRRFAMHDYIIITHGQGWAPGGSVTVRDLRVNGPACGSADCLAGETVISQAKPGLRLALNHLSPLSYLAQVESYAVEYEAQRILGLKHDESNFMFGGHWSDRGLMNIKRAEAIRYLTHAIKNRNIFVGSDGSDRGEWQTD